MSLRQFRARTSELALPEEIYDKYEKVVKGCKICNEAATVHPRSKVSGIRARNFGDVIFADHAEIEHDNRKYIVLLTLDGATNLLSGFPQQDTMAVTTQECIREWMDNHNCKPKNIVADMAFMGTSFLAFYGQHGVNSYPTGARTPWPNRAESAVRLFKASFRILSKAAQEEAILAKATFRQVAVSYTHLTLPTKA